MANISKMLLAAFAIHLCLIMLGLADIPGSSLYTFLAAPQAWTASIFLNMIDDLFLTIGGLLIIAGTILTKNDLLVFAGISGVFLSFGLPLAELWILINAQANSTVATIFVSPIILIYITAVLSFWRGRAD